MELKTASAMLSAFGHAGRLAIFRLLVKAGPDGLPVGEIARLVAVAPNALSVNLGVLSRSGLLRSHRDVRTITYAVDYEVLTDLLTFLTADCRHAAQNVCEALSDVLIRREPQPAVEEVLV